MLIGFDILIASNQLDMPLTVSDNTSVIEVIVMQPGQPTYRSKVSSRSYFLGCNSIGDRDASVRQSGSASMAGDSKLCHAHMPVADTISVEDLLLMHLLASLGGLILVDELGKAPVCAVDLAVASAT